MKRKNMQHTITHKEFVTTYFDGYEASRLEIAGMGFQAARDKFNLDNPVGCKLSMSAYYYAKGQVQALLDFQ